MAFNQPNYYGYQQYGQPQMNNPYMYQAMQQPIMQTTQPIMTQQPQTQPQIQQQIPTLYGKVVDGIDVVKAMDVPINQVAICPKADLSTVYIKSWNVDGTTRVNEYKLVSTEPISEENNINLILDDIKLSIINLDKKIDKIKNGNTQPRKKVIEEGREE